MRPGAAWSFCWSRRACRRRRVRGFGRDHRNSGGKAPRVGLPDRFVCGFRSRHGKHCWITLPTSPLFKRKAGSSTLPAKATRRALTHISRARAISLSSTGGEMLRRVCTTTRTSATATRSWLQAGLLRLSLMFSCGESGGHGAEEKGPSRLRFRNNSQPCAPFSTPSAPTYGRTQPCLVVKREPLAAHREDCWPRHNSNGGRCESTGSDFAQALKKDKGTGKRVMSTRSQGLRLM